MIEAIPRQIRINKEGIWYYGDDEIFREEIILLFYDNLKRDQSGRYLIELGNEKCYVEVEDVPFVVKAARRDGTGDEEGEVFYLYLSDGKCEPLDPSTLCVGNDNILYCSIRNAAFTARFSRAAYYQIANCIEYNAEKKEYFIPLNGQSHYIKQSSENQSSQF
jgi:uncharacterized protein